MIVISRLAGEAIVIGDNITVTILEIDGDEVVFEIDSLDEEIRVTAGEEPMLCDR